MTDDDYKQFLLFKLLDYDLSDINYIAVDYDGEIVVCEFEMETETNFELKYGEMYWVCRRNDKQYAKCIGIFVNDVPENYDKILIKL